MGPRDQVWGGGRCGAWTEHVCSSGRGRRGQGALRKGPGCEGTDVGEAPRCGEGPDLAAGGWDVWVGRQGLGGAEVWTAEIGIMQGHWRGSQVCEEAQVWAGWAREGARAVRWEGRGAVGGNWPWGEGPVVGQEAPQSVGSG